MHPKARRGVVSSLASFKEPQVTEALKKLAESDPSYFVEADATYTWAVSQFRPGEHSEEKRQSEVELFLNRQLQKSSYREVIRSQALQALSEFPQIGSGNQKTVLKTLMEWTRRGKPNDARLAAVKALGKVLKVSQEPQKHQILELFNTLADEDNFRLRMQMVATLEDAAFPEGIPILEKCQQMDADGRVKRGAASAIDTLRTSGGVPESVTTLKEALEKLEQDYRKLKSQFEEERASK
jgi:aminopeptidase N